MRITVKTTGLLGKHLPEGSSRNKGVVEIPDNSTVLDLLQQLSIPDNGRCYVTFNGTVLQKNELDTTVITPADAITLMAPITAG